MGVSISPPPGDAPLPALRDTPGVKSGGDRKDFEMTAAQFEMLEATEAEELLRARFESLAWHGCPPGNALVIASHTDVELLDAIVLLQRGCPPHLVLPILSD
jgi:hypothetical protein